MTQRSELADEVQGPPSRAVLDSFFNHDGGNATMFVGRNIHNAMRRYPGLIAALKWARGVDVKEIEPIPLGAGN